MYPLSSKQAVCMQSGHWKANFLKSTVQVRSPHEHVLARFKEKQVLRLMHISCKDLEYFLKREPVKKPALRLFLWLVVVTLPKKPL